MQADSSDGKNEGMPAPVIHEFAPVARELSGCQSRSDLLSGPRRQPIAQLVMATAAMCDASVLSLDVFDTFLLRNDKSEARRFFELSTLVRRKIGSASTQSASIPHADVDFLVARIDAMALCYRVRTAVEGCREGHIRSVVRAARLALDLPIEIEEEFLAAEVEYESECVIINPALLDAAREFKARGGRVVLMSDMYLGSEQIKAIIERLDPSVCRIIDEVFSSADHVLSKRSGKIFALVERSLGKSGADFLHIGDALEGDIFQARSAGWNVLHFPISHAESVRRAADLSRFQTELAALGHDSTRWAKV